MAVNPATPVLPTRATNNERGYINIDVQAADPNDPTSTGSNAKALAVFVAGTLNSDGSISKGGAGGGGSPASIPNGSDVAEGATTDAAYSDTTGAAAGSVISLLKGFFRSWFIQSFNLVVSSIAGGNPLNVKAAAGQFRGWWGQNGAAITYLQLYNKATAPVIGTDVPVMTYPIAANALFNQSIPGGGKIFPTGLAFAFTTDAAGTTGAAAGAVTAFTIFYN